MRPSSCDRVDFSACASSARRCPKAPSWGEGEGEAKGLRIGMGVGTRLGFVTCNSAIPAATACATSSTLGVAACMLLPSRATGAADALCFPSAGDEERCRVPTKLGASESGAVAAAAASATATAVAVRAATVPQRTHGRGASVVRSGEQERWVSAQHDLAARVRVAETGRQVEVRGEGACTRRLDCRQMQLLLLRDAHRWRRRGTSLRLSVRSCGCGKARKVLQAGAFSAACSQACRHQTWCTRGPHALLGARIVSRASSPFRGEKERKPKQRTRVACSQHVRKQKNTPVGGEPHFTPGSVSRGVDPRGRAREASSEAVLLIAVGPHLVLERLRGVSQAGVGWSGATGFAARLLAAASPCLPGCAGPFGQFAASTGPFGHRTEFSLKFGTF
eukprot:6175334-Pleurochrysis_carterae.AAC.4